MSDIAALVAFMNARLDERETAAKAWLPLPGGHMHRHWLSEPAWREHSHLGGGAPHQHDPDTDGQVPAPAVGDPELALRSVEAMRTILREHQAVTKLAQLTEAELGFLGWYREWVLRHFVAIWRNHPDYQPAWAPEPVR